MVDLLKDIDNGDALDAAKNGNLVPLLSRLKQRYYLNDESLAWISARLEGKKDGCQKTGGKSNPDEHIINLEMYFMYRWLVDIEELSRKNARFWLLKIYSGKDDTIRKQIKKLEALKPNRMAEAALSLGGNKQAFLKTKENKYRPLPIQKFGTQLSKK